MLVGTLTGTECPQLSITAQAAQEISNRFASFASNYSRETVICSPLNRRAKRFRG